MGLLTHRMQKVYCKDILSLWYAMVPMSRLYHMYVCVCVHACMRATGLCAYWYSSVDTHAHTYVNVCMFACVYQSVCMAI